MNFRALISPGTLTWDHFSETLKAKIAKLASGGDVRTLVAELISTTINGGAGTDVVDDVVYGMGYTVAAVATTNLDLIGPETIDTVAVVPGDLVLANGQTVLADRDVYMVQDVGVPWTRHGYTPDTLPTGAIVRVLGGVNGKGSVYMLMSGTNDRENDDKEWRHINAGASLSLTTIEVNLGSTPRRSGYFDFIPATSAISRPVLVTQAVGPYTGKGTRADEAEMDMIVATAVTATDGSAVGVYWKSVGGPVKGNFKFNYAIG